MHCSGQQGDELCTVCINALSVCVLQKPYVCITALNPQYSYTDSEKSPQLMTGGGAFASISICMHALTCMLLCHFLYAFHFAATIFAFFLYIDCSPSPPVL